MDTKDIILLGFRDGVCQASIDPDYVDDLGYRRGHTDGLDVFRKYKLELEASSSPKHLPYWTCQPQVASK